MPFVRHRNQNIHYTVEGSGPLLIMQHGMFSDAAHWQERGFAAPFAQHFTVACVDSIAHGESDTPLDPTCYAQQQRAGDIVAVMDDIGTDKAHVLGYSMGGWIAVGMAKYYPDRLSSLTVGGWDALDGTATAGRVMGLDTVSFDILFAGISAVAPELVTHVTAENRPAYEACFAALSDTDGAAEALISLDVPVLLWNGMEDPYHTTMQPFAEKNGFQYLATPGDHWVAMSEHGADTASAICKFLQTGSL